MVEKRYQVIIVGGGPVGVALAVNLGLRGISCALIESRAGLHRIPKGQNLTQRTLEHFYFWGITEELRAARLMPRGHPIGEITAYGELLGQYWHAPAGRELVRPYYFQDIDRMPQYQMEAVLRKKLATVTCVDTFYGWTAQAVAQDEHGVRADIAEEEGGGRAALTGDYLAGCDGARSLVREAIGVVRSGTDFDRLMVLMVFRSRELHELLKRFPDRSTYRVMHPDFEGFWQFFGRIDVGESFFFHAPVARDTVQDGFDFHAPLRRAIGRDAAVEFDYTGFWELRNAVAETYRKDRIFIAGDAAHTHPPYGGYGLNNGLEDAANLAWKMSAKLQGWGGEALLQSYSAERRPVFRDVADNFIAARIRDDAAFFARHNPARDRADFETAWETRKTDLGTRVRSYEPNYEGSPVVVGPPGGTTSGFGEHRFDARAGHHLAPQVLSSGRNVYEELGGGFTLLAFGAPDGNARAMADAATALSIPLKLIEDSFAGGREAYGKGMVLVRPDQFIAWTGDAAPADPRALIRQVAGLD
ncbi:MAG TPA: FAD-dependent monooxygenase [Pseudolabrys sp.]|nr:FAD-dependent monooxygenase [Pseudolabrys sp.]